MDEQAEDDEYTCRHCRFWCLERTDEHFKLDIGSCNLHPPRLLPGAEMDDDRLRDMDELDPNHFYRPLTYHFDYCGHFKEQG